MLPFEEEDGAPLKKEQRDFDRIQVQVAIASAMAELQLLRQRVEQSKDYIQKARSRRRGQNTGANTTGRQELDMADRATLQEHLALAEKHLVIAQKNIDRQRQLVGKLERDGHSTERAKALLAQFEELNDLHITDRDRLVKELTELK